MFFDVDYRAYSWVSLNEAASVCGEAARVCDVIIGNDDEFGVLAGGYDGGMAHAKALADSDKVVVYKMGAKGSVTFADGKQFETPIFPVTAIKPTGAGDAFMAGFASGLASGMSLSKCVRRGSAAAAIVVTRVGCAPAMPTETELVEFMSTGS